MNKKPHILFALRPDYQENPGGDTIQMEAWRTSLEQCGHLVTISSDCCDKSVWDQCDLVFIWHLERIHESFPWWRAAKQRGVPIVLIPTYYHAGKRCYGYSLWRQMELWGRCFLGRPSMLSYSWSRCRKLMLMDSSLLIVNSRAERELLIREGANSERIAIIPNVVTLTSMEEEPLKWNDRTRIIYVGHFCPRKNQLALIKALKNYPIRITFIGGARPMHKRYMDRCIKAAGGQHEFLGKLSHAATLQIMNKSRYAISASLAETPGIANLEAAMAGCGLILPALAPIQEYFEGCAVHYIDPCNIDPAALERMLQLPPDPALQQRIKERYTEAVLPALWEKLNLDLNP